MAEEDKTNKDQQPKDDDVSAVTADDQNSDSYLILAGHGAPEEGAPLGKDPVYGFSDGVDTINSDMLHDVTRRDIADNKGANEIGAEDPPASNTDADNKQGDKQGDTKPKDSKADKKQDTKKAEPGDDDDNLIDPDDPRGVQKRIIRAVKRQREAEKAREDAQKKLDELTARLERLEKGNTSSGDTDTKPAANQTDAGSSSALVEPKADDFDDYDEYQKALRKYDRAVVAKEIRAELEREKAQAEAIRRQAEIEKRFNEGRKKYADFDEVAMSPDVPCTDLMAETIAATEIPEEIAYYLGQNMDIADEIAGMTPIQQVKAIGRLEGEILANAGAAVQNDAPLKQTPKAHTNPPPPHPINTLGGGTDTGPVDISKLPYPEYERIMNERDRKRANVI